MFLRTKRSFQQNGCRVTVTQVLEHLKEQSCPDMAKTVAKRSRWENQFTLGHIL